MLYALNLASDNRILSVTYDEYAPAGQPRVTELPEGDVSNYKYVNNEYVYDPLPEPEPAPEPISVSQIRADVDFLAMMADIEL